MRCVLDADVGGRVCAPAKGGVLLVGSISGGRCITSQQRASQVVFMTPKPVHEPHL